MEVYVFALTVHWHACTNDNICKCLHVLVNKLSEGVVLVSTEASQSKSGTLRYQMLSIFCLFLENGQSLIVLVHEDIKVEQCVKGMNVGLFKVQYSLVF